MFSSQDHPLAVLDQLDLAAGLIGDGPGNGLEGVEVLHLGAGAQLLGAGGADRQVHVAPQGTLLHLAVGYPQVLQGGLQLLQVGDDLVGGAEVGLGDDLDEGDAAAVAVDQRTQLRIMDELAGVLLNMDPGDPHPLASLRAFDIEVTAGAQREVVLGDLIGLGQVRVEIILPVLLGVGGNGAVGGQACLDGIVHHLLVQHRERARHAGADRAALGIGLSPKGCGAAAENLGLRFKLDVHLEAYDHFIALRHRITLLSRSVRHAGRPAPGQRPPGIG